MRPSDLIYSVWEKPPAIVCLANAAQHAVLIAPTMINPILVMRATGATEEIIVQTISLSFIALGFATVLQAQPRSWIGSGYLIAIIPATAYVPVSILAMNAGGLPLLFGMTLLAGVCEIGFAQAVQRLRAFFPAEISGLCILLIGVYGGVLGIGAVFGLDASTGRSSATVQEIAVSAVTLALMIGLNVWGKGALRMYCAIIGIAAGYLAGVFAGALSLNAKTVLSAVPLIDLPHWSGKLPAFSADLIVPFMAAALTCALRGMGDITTCQKINDRDWIRPDMISIRNGIVSNGVGTIVAACVGGIGGNTTSASIGMSNATGVTSRWVAYWLGGLLVLLSAFPVIAAVLVATPRAVIGALLLFGSCYVMINGLQIIATRLLDPRRTFIIGLALVLSLSHDLFPELYRSAPAAIQPFVGSGLVLGLVSALLLNAIFRAGVRTRTSTLIERRMDAPDAIRTFLEQQGARWGARRDVMERAIFGTIQAVESITEHCNVEGPIAIEASFDEFKLDIRLSWRGDDFMLEDRRPTDDEIRDSEDGIRRLAGYLIHRNADGVRASRKGDLAMLEFHFQH
jgi:xanthine permease XanP